MNQKEPSELSNQELVDKAKKMKSIPISNTVFIGVMFGIVIFSIVKNTLGFFILIPLYFIYKAFNNPNN